MVGDTALTSSGGNNCSTDLWIARDSAHPLRRPQGRLDDIPDIREYPFVDMERIQLPRAHGAWLPPGAAQLQMEFRI